MGGHGGLNILPQKRWNVYNYDNREKVKRDEEAAAKEEQLKRDQSRRRDAELRLNELRQARGLSVPDSDPKPSSSSAPVQTELPKSDSDSKHMNLLEGIRIFDPVEVDKRKVDEKKGKFDRIKRVKKEEEVRVVGPEDEKYRLGYGVAGKGVKLPWYMEKRERSGDGDRDGERDDERRKRGGGGEKKRKTIEELREERIKRERGEKERERALLMVKSRKDGGLSLRR